MAQVVGILFAFYLSWKFGHEEMGFHAWICKYEEHKRQRMKKPSKEQTYRMNQQMRLCINLLPVVPYG